MKELKIATREEMLNAYEIVRESGLTNMFNIKRVIELAEELGGVVLTKEDVIDIMDKY